MFVPPIPRRDETLPPEDDAATSAPFVTRPEFTATVGEIRRRLDVVEAAQREGDVALATKLHEVSDAVTLIAGETAAQTRTLADQAKAFDRYATREDLAQLATQEQLGALRATLESKDAAHEKGMTDLGRAVKALRAKVATRWQAYAQIAAGLAAIAAALAGAFAR